MRPTRRAVLAGLLTAPALGAAPAAGPGTKLLLVSAYGGWDTTYALDPKAGQPAFDVPAGEVRAFADLDVFSAPDRPSVDAFFDRAAPISTIVRGISVSSLSHPQCTRRIYTGVPTAGAADVAAIAASVRGADRPLPYLVASAAAFSGPLAAQSAHTGTTNQIAGLIDPAVSPPLTDAAHRRFVPDAADQADIVAWLEARAERAARGARGVDIERVDDFTGSLARAEALDAYAGVFEPSAAPPTFEAQAGQAVRALSSGLSWSVTIDSRLDFDTHVGNVRQGPMHETLFQRLGVLLTLLEQTPGEAAGSVLLDEVAVVVVSEMTRTPRLTAGGGKDHWPFATLLVFGAGVRGGRVVGATDEQGLGLPLDLASGEIGRGSVLEPPSVLAGLLSLSGVDPAPHFPGVEVFRAFLA